MKTCLEETKTNQEKIRGRTGALWTGTTRKNHAPSYLPVDPGSPCTRSA
jgi:hypothetical protein